MRILVVDDHRLFLDGVRYLLSRLGTQVEVEELTDASLVMNRLGEKRCFDLVLMDLHMPGLGGLSLLRRISDLGIGLPVVVISGETDKAKIQACLSAGALGFIPKSFGAEEMLNALRQVLSGEVFLPAELAPDLERSASTIEGHAEAGITRRQLDVLRLLAMGYDNRKIAKSLFISEHTVKAHVSALFHAFGVNNRTACVRAAEDRGLLADRL